jgi:hypothetical protein
MSAGVKYVAALKHVSEVALPGTADLAFWSDALEHAGLHPTECDGRAQLMISAVEARFLGVIFQEASICVFVSSRKGGSGQDGVYLPRAFNSSRFFAFVERQWFSTPYVHASLRIGARNPASIEISRDGKTVLTAMMSAALPGRSPSRIGHEDWRGPVFIPKTRAKRNQLDKFFHASVSGTNSIYPFLSSEDRTAIQPTKDDMDVKSLLESSFTASEWAIREDATHAKGKTVERDSVEPAFGG